jgi:hypothetical protein
MPTVKKQNKKITVKTSGSRHNYDGGHFADIKQQNSRKC